MGTHITSTSGTGRTSLTVLYDGDCGICTHTARLLGRLDSGRRLRLVPLQSADVPGAPPADVLMGALHATDGRGAWHAGARAAVEIARHLPPLRPIAFLARLPLGMLVIDAWYRAVANNRQTLSRLLGFRVCRVPSRRA